MYDLRCAWRCAGLLSSRWLASGPHAVERHRPEARTLRLPPSVDKSVRIVFTQRARDRVSDARDARQLQRRARVNVNRRA
jgi:hypothetical protein